MHGQALVLFALNTSRQRNSVAPIDNGTARSPSSGMGYRYLSLAPQAAVAPEAPLSASSGTVYQMVEAELTQRSIPADVIRLFSGVRVYRIPEPYVWRLSSDGIGPYIPNGPKIRYHAVRTDPTTNEPRRDEWKPVY